ncbi:TetR/AcrR family transcriptional regulator [Sciscionella sediminilitoris]|uniref:TetR/AcrR family transcriptional regulator n=1 Tax=Sciscionella sediminilitoris TaxID=1445613 RepID=UPI00068A0B3A|nr:TetR/AcrR family transcriptional regulator [Sciscionella sp. SE31]
MHADNGAAMRERTFTEVARRDQIVRAAISTLAELGYAETSLGKIARTAGLSSVGMISYYFDSKADLMAEVRTTVLAGAEAEVGPRVRGAPGKLAALRAYIEASLEYIAGHTAEMAALFEISSGRRTRVESTEEDIEAVSVRIVAELVAGAQEELGIPDPLDPRVVARAVRGAIRTATAARVQEEGSAHPVDLSREGPRIADLFERSLRFVPDPGGSR